MRFNEALLRATSAAKQARAPEMAEEILIELMMAARSEDGTILAEGCTVEISVSELARRLGTSNFWRVVTMLDCMGDLLDVYYLSEGDNIRCVLDRAMAAPPCNPGGKRAY